MSKAIEIKNLNKELKNFQSGERFYLDNINLSIETGTIVGLIGKNGAGKTTLLNTIMNVIKLDSGNIEVLGVDNRSEAFAKAKENIGVVLDQLGIYEGFTIDNINKLMGYAYKNWDSQYFFSILKKLDIYSRKAIKEFSTGMKKKLAIAISLGHHPDLLILDEPTANLDPFARNEILDFIYDYTRDDNKTVLISSHILSDLEKICDYVIYIDNGKILLYEEKDQLLEKYALIRIGQDIYDKLDKSIIVNEEKSAYGYELLVEADRLPNGIVKEFVTLDQIVIKLMGKKKNESSTLLWFKNQ